MKKYVMNKNIIHDGRAYPKGCEIASGDPGFEALVKAGHATEMVFREAGASPSPAPVIQEPVEDASEEVKKKGRKKSS